MAKPKRAATETNRRSQTRSAFSRPVSTSTNTQLVHMRRDALCRAAPHRELGR